MGMIHAAKTLQAIDQMLAKDGGGKFRQTLEKIIPKMDDAFRGQEDGFRKHLGASLIGRECSRELWLKFRWATKKAIEPRIIRLFNRGHLEEARFLALLIATGYEVWYETPEGGQFRFKDINGHFGSALDGVIRGIPDIPAGEAAYAEFKTSADKGFQKIKAYGVEAEKYEHYVQMQVCMHKFNLRYALYMVVNKNDDDLHAEIILYNEVVARGHIEEKARNIIFSDAAPLKISESPGWWKCKFCDEKKVCHENTVPEINCRTCAHSTPSATGDDGAWTCARGNMEIFSPAVQVGCPEHVFNPYMLNKIEYNGGNAAMNCTDITLQNGDRILQGPNNVTSQQLKQRGL